MPSTTDTNGSTRDLSAERTAVLTTYPSRRDAEMARDRLVDAGLHAFVTADDAGGMHVQMQLTNGVKLIGLAAEADDALALLDDADLLPEAHDDSPPTDADDGSPRPVFIYGGLALLTLGAFLWWTPTADPFAAYLFGGPGLALLLTGWVRRRR